MIAPLILKYKLFLREVCLEKELGWNNTFSVSLILRWRKLVKEMVKAPKIVVKQCAWPQRAYVVYELEKIGGWSVVK